MPPEGEELLSQRCWGNGEPTLDQHLTQRRLAGRAEVDQDRGIPLEVRDGEDSGESGASSASFSWSPAVRTATIGG